MREQENNTAIAGVFRSDDRGFVMVALLIGMAVTAVWMSAMLPAWRQQAQRQREADLIFRGEQYARAIALYSVKNGALPTTIDDLVQQRFLRKKWNDPITGEEFQLLGGSASPGAVQAGGPGPGQAGGQITGGISGVYSSSTETSIRIYNNAQQYNQWIFSYAVARQQMGQSARPAGGGGRGGDRGDALGTGGGRRGGGGGRGGGRRGGGDAGRAGGGGGRGGGNAGRAGGGGRGAGS
jgi:type II secretory pathway pseudopilin PulG